jgi:lipid II:glycine glycyltransferase (peptidoglycan interpeptide bridge formation enzyme)
MRTERLTSADSARWSDFVAASPAGDVLQCMEWGELKSRTGWRPFTVAVIEQEAIVAGATVLCRRAPLGRSLLYCPRGPVVDLLANTAACEALIQALRELAREQRALAIKIDPPVAAAKAGDALRTLGFRRAPVAEVGFGGTQPRAVMKLSPLGDDDALLARFKPKTRYNLRLAERKGVEVTGETTRDDLRAFHRVLLETGERDGFHVRGLDYYEALWDCLIERGLGRLFLARHEGQVLAGAIDFRLGHQCWYVYGASSNARRNLMPNHLLQWRMIQWARDNGCTVYDFRGVPLDRPGVEDLGGLVRFKAGFAADYVEYVGEWDLPLSALWYGAFNLLEPLVRRIRLGPRLA